ncbi:MAG: hypothetical protein H7839_17985 [Magnetococcus sp. YQC-5]
MKDGKTKEIPVNVELLSDDNRVGLFLAIGCLLLGISLSDLIGFELFFQKDGLGDLLLRPLLLGVGGLLVFLCARRLLVPGCKPLLRINFGGVTDVRLTTVPIRWSLIVHARRPNGIWFYLLHGVILELVEGYESTGVETLWSRLIHLPVRLQGSHMLFLECGSLDMSADQALKAIHSHLHARQSGSRR